MVNGPCTVRQLADALLGHNEHPRPIHNQCRALIKKGLLVRDDSLGDWIYDVSHCGIQQPTNRVGDVVEKRAGNERKCAGSLKKRTAGKVKVVIQCAGRKICAPTLSQGDQALNFVATPRLGPPNERAPWDALPALNSDTWIDCVRDYNDKKILPLGIAVSKGQNLTTAGSLYRRSIYQDLIRTVGSQNVYILSAGWGLIRADDKIPPYNVTFSNNALLEAKITPAKRGLHGSIRKAVDGDDEIHLFLTPKYLEYWVKCFSGQFGSRKVILHWRKSQKLPRLSGSPNDIYWHCCGSQRTWPYDAAIQWLQKVSKMCNPGSCSNKSKSDECNDNARRSNVGDSPAIDYN
jgi:hypothetical protein